MKWMEIISIRSIPGSRNVLKEHLRELILDIRKKEPGEAIRVYCHMTVETDFNIHLLHQSESPEINGSSLGLYLASSLKKIGLVHHSVWTQQE